MCCIVEFEDSSDSAISDVSHFRETKDQISLKLSSVGSKQMIELLPYASIKILLKRYPKQVFLFYVTASAGNSNYIIVDFSLPRLIHFQKFCQNQN